ncbi:hypothetical protein [Paenibacillus rigui]|uniref:Uncharacterized protein n=1 Tax=Paenibacillus rigui TaxID=554312 RepID=A0A229UV36_9BACL|nr:hypothetical protein [Paenibacillus rigui]OXM87278.1 hypothetical protein CF651_06475 [Paenibacillus rigui]
MKRAIILLALIGSISLASAGCQQAPAGLSVSAGDQGTPSSTGSPKQNQSQGQNQGQAPDQQSRKSLQGKGFTQEEAGIKLRVDMPELQAFLQQAKAGPIVPALLQDAVPQGLALVEDKQWILISHYRTGGKSSLLSVIDAGSGKLVKVVELYTNATTPYNGHAGGIAASPKHVWVSSGEEVSILNIDDIQKAEDGGRLVFQGSVRSDTRASFAAYADGILWIGEFAHGKDYPTKESHYATNRDDKQHKAWAEGYRLDAATDLPPGAASDAKGQQPTPNYILSLPDNVQGMYVGKDSIRLSQSYGRNNASTLLTFKNSLAEKPHASVSLNSAVIPMWFLDSKNRTGSMELPPMSEGIAESEGSLYILFESGAAPYRSSSSYALDRLQIIPAK